LQSILAATSSIAPATGSKCKPPAATEGTLLSFPPRLKQQPPASATPLYFQQQPSLFSSGSTNFSDLSSKHREQQQLFLLNHGCRPPSSALAWEKKQKREKENGRAQYKQGEHRKKIRGRTKGKHVGVVCK
jgi:hypothetical protein